jgi:tetratricopeptide (TPR) repeat protein
VTDEQFRFRSQIAREVAYATLTKAERARRHGKLARTLAEDAEREGRVDEVIDQLAYHFDLATSLYGELSPDMHAPEGMYAGAVRFLERAAARAEQSEDWKRAEAYLTHAIKLQPTAGGGDSAPLRIARARARAEVRNLGGASDDLNTIFATGSIADTDPHLFAEALTVLADVEYKEANVKGSMQTFERAIERWRELGDRPGLADALRRCGLAAIFRSSYDQAREHLDEALEIFRSIGDRRGEAWSLQNLAWAAFSSGRYDEAEVHLDASAAMFGDVGDWGGVSWALGLLAWVRYTQGDLTESAALAERTLREADELGDRWAGAMTRVLLANLHLWQGRATKALDLAQEAQTTFVELGDSWGETQAISPQATALNALGRFAESDATIDALASVASRLDDVGLTDLPMLQKIAIQLQRGTADIDPAGVEHLTTRASQGPASDESRTVLGLVALQEGKAARSVEILTEAVALTSGPGSTASVTAALSLALVAAGRLDEALALCGDDVAITYIDAYRLELAQAFAELRKGHADAGRAALDRAIALVEPTESVLDRAAVHCAVAAFEGTSDSATELGMRMRGWETVFALMADRPG